MGQICQLLCSAVTQTRLLISAGKCLLGDHQGVTVVAITIWSFPTCSDTEHRFLIKSSRIAQEEIGIPFYRRLAPNHPTSLPLHQGLISTVGHCSCMPRRPAVPGPACWEDASRTQPLPLGPSASWSPQSHLLSAV